MKPAGEITIKCSEGEFDYTPAKQRVRLKDGDGVEFKVNCPGVEEGTWALNFGWGTPFEKGRYDASIRDTIEAKFHANARHGRYEYFVAVSIPGNHWTDDPDFIIEP